MNYNYQMQQPTSLLGFQPHAIAQRSGSSSYADYINGHSGTPASNEPPLDPERFSRNAWMRTQLMRGLRPGGPMMAPPQQPVGQAAPPVGLNGYVRAQTPGAVMRYQPPAQSGAGTPGTPWWWNQTPPGIPFSDKTPMGGAKPPKPQPGGYQKHTGGMVNWRRKPMMIPV
jgi:hypothetical protein